MLILTDSNPASLLMAADHLRRHELMGRETFIKEPDGSFRSLNLALHVIDISIALAEDEDSLFYALDHLLEGGGVPELVLTIGQVPPWERKQTDAYLKEIGKFLGSVADGEEWSGMDFKAVWYVPEKQSTLCSIAAKHKQAIRLEINPFYEHLQHHQWQLDHRHTLDAIDKALRLHWLDYRADSRVLADLLIDIARKNPAGEGEK